jgi:hypothetical protein
MSFELSIQMLRRCSTGILSFSFLRAFETCSFQNTYPPQPCDGLERYQLNYMKLLNKCRAFVDFSSCALASFMGMQQDKMNHDCLHRWHV